MTFLVSTLPASLDVASSAHPWFFPSLQPIFSGLFRLIAYIVAIIPIWPWEEVTAMSAYSATILDLSCQIVLKD